MKTVFHEAGSRGFATHGWLTTHHSFSFASYYDAERMGFGALRVLNDDVIAPGAGFGQHPHDNMEIITIPLSGALKHEDTTGQAAVIVAGEVQVMSAGTGVEHAEYNASSTEELSLLQIWILTDSQDTIPRYDQKRFDPVRYRGSFFPVVGKLGQENVLGIHQDAKISLGRFEAGEEQSYRLRDAGRGVYFFVIEGSVILAGKKLKKRDALGVWETDHIGLRAEKEALVLAIEVPMTVS